MKLTIRGDLADLDIEIILQPSVVRQAGGAAAEQAPAEGQPTNTPAGSSAANPIDIPATMASIGDQVRAAVANPPPPVEAPVELDLRRPPVEDDALEIPAFLRRAS